MLKFFLLKYKWGLKGGGNRGGLVLFVLLLYVFSLRNICKEYKYMFVNIMLILILKCVIMFNIINVLINNFKKLVILLNMLF